MYDERLRRVGEKSFLNLIIVWKIQIKLLFEAYLDVEINISCIIERVESE